MPRRALVPAVGFVFATAVVLLTMPRRMIVVISGAAYGAARRALDVGPGEALRTL